MDKLIATSERVLTECEEVERRSGDREEARRQRMLEMQIRFEDEVALGKNSLNMDLDQRITRLREEYASIERTICPPPVVASTSSSFFPPPPATDS